MDAALAWPVFLQEAQASLDQMKHSSILDTGQSIKWHGGQ